MAVREAIAGVAIDVSASMATSIRNNTRPDLHRLDAVREALVTVTSRLTAVHGLAGGASPAGGLDVFAYVFGLRHLPAEVCDLLTLLRIGKEGAPPTTPWSPGGGDPYLELGSLAEHHGRAGWVPWITSNLDETQAAALVANLGRHPVLAGEFGRLLPDFSAAEIEYATGLKDVAQQGFRGWLRGARSVGKSMRSGEVSAKRVSIEVARAGGPARVQRQMDEAQQILNELTGAVLSKEELMDRFREPLGAALWAQVAELGETTLPLSDVPGLMTRLAGDSSLTQLFLYGNTPMCSALQTIEDRFHRELVRTPGIPATLIVVSDGEPTDGDPLELISRIAGSGVTVISCFVTDRDLQAPRALPAKQARDWTRGARLMYKMASVIEPGSVLAGRLRNWGWEVPPGARLFAQVNHSTILREFLRAALG